MSLASFESYVTKNNVQAPNAVWSVRWVKRMFEYWRVDESQLLSFDTERLS